MKAGHFEMERDRAIAHMIELQENLDAKSEGIDILRLDRAQWAETTHRLRAALKQYGRHLRDDMDREYCTSVKCACGFDAALDPPAGEST